MCNKATLDSSTYMYNIRVSNYNVMDFLGPYAIRINGTIHKNRHNKLITGHYYQSLVPRPGKRPGTHRLRMCYSLYPKSGYIVKYAVKGSVYFIDSIMPSLMLQVLDVEQQAKFSKTLALLFFWRKKSGIGCVTNCRLR